VDESYWEGLLKYDKDKKKMLQGQALDIVLRMARFFPHKSGQDEEAIEEVEQLLTQFEDTGDYTEDDYMED
jgi:hypothetical protein